MSRTLFENSKAALAFAGVTIIGAVIMIGSPDNEGVLDKTVDSLSEERMSITEDAPEFIETQSKPSVVIDPDAGWGSSSQRTMYRDARPEHSSLDVDEEIRPSPRENFNREPQTFIPGPQPVVADNVGIPVPGPD